MDRSFETIDKDDLIRLARIAIEDREELFRRKPELGRIYKNRIICIALCQGAALHYLDGVNGIKDFDVWTIYCAHPHRPFPPRRNVPRDFGDGKFGKTPGWTHFVGRRVDCIGRSIPCEPEQHPFDAVIAWLRKSPNPSPRMLAQKAVIILEPASDLGRVLWP